MISLNLLDASTARAAERASKHARRINERLERDVPLLLRAGVVAPVTSREAAARLDRRAQHEAEKQAAEHAETLVVVALWERTLAALGVDAPALDAHAPRSPEYFADRLHSTARNAAPWVFYGGRFTRCERCGASARGVGEFTRDCEREAAFMLIHARCEMPAHDGEELDADIVIDHERVDGTTVWPIGGHWTHVIAKALGVRAEWGRAYGKRYVPVLGSRRLDAPTIDVMALAAELHRAGARVHVTPEAAVKRCDAARGGRMKRRCSCPRCSRRAEDLSVPPRCATCRSCGCTSDLPRCTPLEAPQRALPTGGAACPA